MQTFIDLEGLTRQADQFAYADALELEGYYLPYDERMNLLASLRKGSGVRIITGPLGAPFWGLVSGAVVIEVVPDGYVYKERHGSVIEWGLRVAGCDSAEVGRLLRRKSPPTAKHGLFEKWTRAQILVGMLRDVKVEPLVVSELDVEVGHVAEALDEFSQGDIVAQDWEWDVHTKLPEGLSSSLQFRNLYIPVRGEDRSMDSARGESLRNRWKDILRTVPVVLHGGRADLATQYPGNPVELVDTPPDDTMVMAYLVGEPQLGLKVLAKKLLGCDPMEYPSDFADLPLEVQAQYAGADARNTYDLYKQLLGRIVETGQLDIYERLERPLVPIIASMEKYGVPVDVRAMLSAYKDAVTLEVNMQRAIYDRYGYDVRSDKESRAMLFSELGHDPGTLDQRVLTMYPDGVVDLLLFYRRARTQRRNFLGKHIKRWVAAEKPKDFKLYPRFNQAGNPDGNILAPRSGRLSSSDPNLQQQPATIRSIFIPPRGYKWWAYDYGQLELRVAAVISRDERMLSLLISGGDIHSTLQRRVYDISGTHIPRIAAKKWNFGKLYGASINTQIEGLALVRIFLDRETALVMDKAHATLFPEYPNWAKRYVEECKQRGYAETLFGRRRYMSEFDDPDPKVQAHGERAAVNHAIQGTAADIVKAAMIAVQPVLRQYGGHLAIQVHDELCGWVPYKNGIYMEEFDYRMKLTMENIDLPGMPLVVSGGVGDNWAEVH